VRNRVAHHRSRRCCGTRTYDVDVITEIASYADYVVFSERLRELGFEEDRREGAPLCRWQHGDLILDVMPLDAKILGFSKPLVR
jgi:hypothetical protein